MQESLFASQTYFVKGGQGRLCCDDNDQAIMILHNGGKNECFRLIVRPIFLFCCLLPIYIPRVNKTNRSQVWLSLICFYLQNLIHNYAWWQLKTNPIRIQPALLCRISCLIGIGGLDIVPSMDTGTLHQNCWMKMIQPCQDKDKDLNSLAWPSKEHCSPEVSVEMNLEDFNVLLMQNTTELGHDISILDRNAWLLSLWDFYMHTEGKEKKDEMYIGGTIFVDHALGMSTFLRISFWCFQVRPLAIRAIVCNPAWSTCETLSHRQSSVSFEGVPRCPILASSVCWNTFRHALVQM